MTKSASRAFWLALLSATLTLPTSATTIINSNGFEAPAFQPGALSGQGGWQVAHAGLPTTTAGVQDQVVLDGSQALRIDRGSSSGGYFINFGEGGGQGGPYAPLSGRFVSIDWDMRYDPVPPTSVGVGPFFGVQVFDESSGSVLQVAGLGVDAATDEVLYQLGNDGQLLALGPASPGEWSNYRIELDFQNDTYSIFLDGQLSLTTPFVEPGGGISRWTDVDIVGIAANADANSVANEGTAYIDNFLVRDGLRGDFNNNGLLDAADYTVWRDQNGSTGFALDADANADGQVTAADYHLWANSLGMTNAVAGSSATVPEPAASVLLILVSLTQLAQTRRSAKLCHQLRSNLLPPGTGF